MNSRELFSIMCELVRAYQLIFEAIDNIDENNYDASEMCMYMAIRKNNDILIDGTRMKWRIDDVDILNEKRDDDDGGNDCDS